MIIHFLEFHTESLYQMKLWGVSCLVHQITAVKLLFIWIPEAISVCLISELFLRKTQRETKQSLGVLWRGFKQCPMVCNHLVPSIVPWELARNIDSQASLDSWLRNSEDRSQPSGFDDPSKGLWMHSRVTGGFRMSLQVGQTGSLLDGPEDLEACVLPAQPPLQ